jgi:hypothetical protein
MRDPTVDQAGVRDEARAIVELGDFQRPLIDHVRDTLDNILRTVELSADLCAQLDQAYEVLAVLRMSGTGIEPADRTPR